MTEPLSDEQLEAIRNRADAATPGPWKALGGSIYTADEETEVADWISHDDTDVTFIAHAREDVPALLDEIERLRFELWSANYGR